MMALSPADRTRLIGILGMMGSEHSGERASAALLASKMVRDRGLSWADLVSSSAGPAASKTLRGAPEPTSDLGLCLRHVGMLREWERDFCLSVSRVGRRSPKQVNVIREIATTLRARGLA